MRRILGFSFVLLVVAGMSLSLPDEVFAGPDFVRFYERGKVRLRQRLFFDAIKDLKIAAKTDRGRQHFAVHFHLAKAYFWLPDIQKAMGTLRKAGGLMRNRRQRRVLDKLKRQIREMYSTLKLIPLVDPEEVGKLKIKIKPKIPFSSSHKRRYFKLFQKRIARQGGLLLNGKSLYLPKGDYEVRIQRSQCLRYSLRKGTQLARELSVEDGGAKLSIAEKPGCGCRGGQKLYKEGRRRYCACKAGSAWNKKKKRCEISKVAINPWPIVLTSLGVLVVGGAVAGIIVAVTARDPGNAAMSTPNEGEKYKIW